MSAKITPPLKWHGGKRYLAPRIIDLMPPRQARDNPNNAAVGASKRRMTECVWCNY